MERETWDSLLSFLLAINDALLAPPAVKDDVGDQLCERVLGVLYEIWLIACVKSFPGPTLWKTFQVPFTHNRDFKQKSYQISISYIGLQAL